MPRVMSALIASFRASPAFTQLSVHTQLNWHRHLDRIDRLLGPRRPRELRKCDVRWLRDEFAATPAEANNTLRALSSMLSWGARRGWLRDNPCLHCKGLMFRPEPYRPWHPETIALLEREGRPDLWAIAAVALYTGQRLGDTLRLSWEDERHGVIDVRQHKTGKLLTIPMHDRLRVLWQTLPRHHAHALVNRRGRPWTAGGFQVSWRKELQREVLRPIRDAGLVFHGLRKSSVAMLLEAGCSDAEVMAITGQSPAMMDHYAREMERSRLVATAIDKWHGTQRHDAASTT